MWSCTFIKARISVFNLIIYLFVLDYLYSLVPQSTSENTFACKSEWNEPLNNVKLMESK